MQNEYNIKNNKQKRETKEKCINFCRLSNYTDF